MNGPAACAARIAAAAAAAAARFPRLVHLVVGRAAGMFCRAAPAAMPRAARLVPGTTAVFTRARASRRAIPLPIGGDGRAGVDDHVVGRDRRRALQREDGVVEYREAVQRDGAFVPGGVVADNDLVGDGERGRRQ